ncbi:MAG: hypothetical protein HY269_10625, partial [Deltaproteobacteria bacterium]|nr:hypothetical protein [Deltaproteobacteria bacterium]
TVARQRDLDVLIDGAGDAFAGGDAAERIPRRPAVRKNGGGQGKDGDGAKRVFRGMMRLERAETWSRGGLQADQYVDLVAMTEGYSNPGAMCGMAKCPKFQVIQAK